MCTCGCENKALKDFDPAEPKEKYFVCSNGDAPESIWFDKDEVFEDSYSEYIDSFDEDGCKVTAYKLVNGEYTEDFQEKVMKCKQCSYYGLYQMITSNKPYGYSGDIPCTRCSELRKENSEFVPASQEITKQAWDNIEG